MTSAPAERVPALVEVEPEAWDDVLERLGCADAYLLRRYVESSCALYGGRPAYLHLPGAGGDVVFSFVLRDVPGRSALQDVTSTYGYGGPVAVGAEPPLERFHELYDDWCRANGVVTTFIRFHPLFANHRYAAPATHLEPRIDTIAWRLDRDLLAEMHPKHRNAVRKAEATVSVTAAQAPADLSAFVDLYEQTMHRVDASGFYFFGAEYWRSLTRLGENLVRFDAQLDGELAAGALCLASKPWLHYHFSATNERGRAAAAATLIVYEAACWAKERGFTHFHLGGGAEGREDSLFRFKLRFSPEDRREAYVGKLVHDAAAYRDLAGPAAHDLTGFFPAYRRTAA